MIQPCVGRKSGFNKKISSNLHLGSEFFENLSFSRRLCFALGADSPAGVHIKDIIKGLVCVCACFPWRLQNAAW